MAEARSPRATWTDERLDDLSRRVDDGFNRIDARFDAIEARIDARFEATHSRMDARFESLQRTMIQVGGGMIATLVVGFASIAVAVA